jgi:hypothetical protein
MKALLSVIAVMVVLTACAANKNEKCKMVGGERDEHEVCTKI